MMKYVRMIPVMLYPYGYIPAIIFLLNAASIDSELVVYVIEAYAVVLTIMALIGAMIHSVFCAGGKYDAGVCARLNMMIHIVQVPGYILNFLLCCLSACASVWGLGIIMFLIVVDILSVIITGIGSVGCSICMWKKNIVSKRAAVIGGIVSFLFCLDVACSIFYYAKAKGK